jgi:hypothetical protein
VKFFKEFSIELCKLVLFPPGNQKPVRILRLAFSYVGNVHCCTDKHQMYGKYGQRRWSKFSVTEHISSVRGDSTLRQVGQKRSVREISPVAESVTNLPIFTKALLFLTSLL